MQRKRLGSSVREASAIGPGTMTGDAQDCALERLGRVVARAAAQ